MAKISPCFKKIFIFFNSLFAIFGIVVFVLALLAHQFVNEPNGLHGVILLYVIGSVIFIIAVLGAYGAYKESKCALIVFFTVMCLATIGMLRIAVPMAASQQELISAVRQQFGTKDVFTKDVEKALDSIQAHLQCCGLNGYEDWKDQVPVSCNCVNEHGPSGECKKITSRKSYQSFWQDRGSESRMVWSQPCGPIIIEYLDKLITIVMGVLFGLATLAILGGLMSLAMIVRVSAPETAIHLSSFPLSYQPPKYSEVVNS
ncbi:tetraspanin-8 [Ictalurus furcatus]|uniref:tetraspanin-8 n=1 Tax=Ictalurus furcatus TaxID=66913 RepID=UPI0023501FF2|nr:tetraspanin-8 [Ictalurus furcatus]